MDSIKPESSPKLSIKSRAFLELTFAGFLWGFGFIGTVWALKFLSPSAILFYRFGISFLAGWALLSLWKVRWNEMRTELHLSLIPGVFLWLTLFPQTWGLQLTTATNSAFITTLYVVIVPLFRSLTGEEKLTFTHWFCVLLALLGMGFIVQIQNVSTLNWGDLLTLICAIFAALHIIVLGQKVQHSRNDLAFNTFQSLWVALFSLLLFPFSKNWSLATLDSEAWLGILSLGFGSSMIAFLLQVRSQKVISPSVASLLFLLESPASCLFAFLLLNEKLIAWQWAGAVMILLSCVVISMTKSKAEHSV